MSIKYNRYTRRQFLAGAGGQFLAIPLLTSLLPREALAQAQTAPRRFLAIAYPQCVMASRTIDPALASLSALSSSAITGLPSYARGLRLSTLPANRLQTPIAASSPRDTFLTHPTIQSLQNAGLMTIVRGIDNALGQGNQHGENWLTGSVNNSGVSQWSPSVDTTMEDSQLIYPNGHGYWKKVLRLNGSISYRKVGTSVSLVQDYYTDGTETNWNGPRALYDALAPRLTGTSAPPPAGDPVNLLKGGILNRVYQAYTAARNNRRLSSVDQQKLDRHMQLMSEIEATLSQVPQAPATGICVNPIPSTQNWQAVKDSYRLHVEVYLKLMVAAMKCNLTKIGTMVLEGHGFYDIGTGGAVFPPNSIPFHNGVIHNEAGLPIPDVETYYTQWQKWNFDTIANLVLGPLHAEIDPLNSNGKSFLENMLVSVLSEGGVDPFPGDHDNRDYQPIMFGNMGGAIRSDRYIVFDPSYTGAAKVGLPYNALQMTWLHAMGLSPSDYVGGSSTTQGYGAYNLAHLNANYSIFNNRFYLPINEILT